LKNALYYGDNLEVLRRDIDDESVDLIYLDPPFNSAATYNVLFRAPGGDAPQAQIEAFEDTWHWTDQAEEAFDDVMRSEHQPAAELLRALRDVLGENDMMAYLAMMAVRLIELQKVLKPTGSLYLHCDPVACHYLKILLDSIMGAENFRSQITWKRTTSHGNVGRNYGSLVDHLLFYTNGANYTWNQIYTPFDPGYVEEKFRNRDPDGRRWQSVTLRNPSPRPNLRYEFKASDGRTYKPHPNGWSCDLERMSRYDLEGRLHFPAKSTGQLRLKMYLDESPGIKVQNLWTDIPAVNSQAAERLGYPTQKPVALLERVVRASSNPGDLVLDPFCGCGTAIHAAQKLDRKWAGIDVTHLAINLVERRLKDAFPGIAFEVHGTPKDLASARKLAAADKHEFEKWAVAAVGAVPFRGGRGADGGIDGLIYFKPDGRKTERAIVSVKGGENVGVAMIRDLGHVVQRERAKIGVFVTLAEPTRPMTTEAYKAGFYETEYRRYLKLQIISVADIFAGKRPDIPLVDQPYRRAPAEDTEQQGELAL
jgi:site-specific DNA-methyltransferase (adenine-specific)